MQNVLGPHEKAIGLAVVGSDQKCLRANQALCQMVGYTEKELLFRSFSDIVHPEDRAISSELVKQLTGGQIASYEFETRLLSKNRRTIWADVKAKSVVCKHGKKTHSLAVIENITETMTMEKLCQRESLAAMGASAAVLVHEISNQLSSISLAAEMIEQYITAGAVRKDKAVLDLLAGMKTEIDQLGSMLNEFRRFGSATKLNLQATHLGSLVAELLASQRAQYTAAGVSVELDCSPGLPPVAIDRQKFKQALLNLWKNALEAMPGGGKLTVRIYRSDELLFLDIQDTGQGIPEGIEVFALFTTTKPKGTGLGLAVVRQIISAHRGAVTYTSAPGRGTTFRLSLPLGR